MHAPGSYFNALFEIDTASCRIDEIERTTQVTQRGQTGARMKSEERFVRSFYFTNQHGTYRSDLIINNACKLQIIFAHAILARIPRLASKIRLSSMQRCIADLTRRLLN